MSTPLTQNPICRSGPNVSTIRLKFKSTRIVVRSKGRGRRRVRRLLGSGPT